MVKSHLPGLVAICSQIEDRQKYSNHDATNNNNPGEPFVWVRSCDMIAEAGFVHIGSISDQDEVGRIDRIHKRMKSWNVYRED